jgi:hypothetical protein
MQLLTQDEQLAQRGDRLKPGPVSRDLLGSRFPARGIDQLASRGWSAAEWAAARDRLASRGWVDAEGKATERGRDGRDEIEWRTDRLADAPWQALGPDRAQRLAELTGPLLGAAFESGLLPSQSTLGIAAVPLPAPRPWRG